MCSSTTSRQDLFAWIPTFMLIHSAKKTAKTMLRNHTKSDLHYAYVFFNFVSALFGATSCRVGALTFCHEKTRR